MVVEATTTAAALRTLQQGARRSFARRMRERVESFLAAGDLAYERNFLIVRPAIALLVLAASLIASGMPGREGVYAACSAAMVYNFAIGVLVFRKRMYLLRAATLVLDNLTVIFGSLYVFHAMGVAGYESDLWLLYFVLIVTSAMYYGPIGSVIFATLWGSLLVGMTVAFYPHDGYSYSALPMRLTFYLLTSFVAISLSAELRAHRRKLERQTRHTLSMLAQIVEARDSDAGQHLGHVTHYSRALALHLGYDAATADEIGYAAMIHDVGKAQVPDAILKKPGPLTMDERREIEKHTIWGHDLLAENGEFSMAGQVARSHHERWDGAGYPDGLRGEAIPVAARITAVADVYDALISERPYKGAWPQEDAVAEIKRLRGTHLDPDVVDAFMALLDAGILDALDAAMRHENAANNHSGTFDLAA